MKREEIVRALEAELRTNSALRHRLGIEGGVDAVADKAGEEVSAVVFGTKDGEDVALTVLMDA